MNLVTLSVAWVLANEAVTAPIIGASRPGQLDASLAAAEFVLEDDLKARTSPTSTAWETHPGRRKPSSHDA